MIKTLPQNPLLTIKDLQIKTHLISGKWWLSLQFWCCHVIMQLHSPLEGTGREYLMPVGTAQQGRAWNDTCRPIEEPICACYFLCLQLATDFKLVNMKKKFNYSRYPYSRWTFWIIFQGENDIQLFSRSKLLC